MNSKNKVLAVDLDGTLFYPKKRIRMISTKNRNFIRGFIDNGGKVLLISGRNNTYLQRVVKLLDRKIDYAGCNGSFLVINNKMQYQSFIDNDYLNRIIKELYKRYNLVAPYLMGRDYVFIVPGKSWGLKNRLVFNLYQKSQGVYEEKAKTDDTLLVNQLKSGKLYKVILFFGFNKSQNQQAYQAYLFLKKHYQKFDYAYLGYSIEVTNVNTNKATAIKQYLDYFKIKHHNVMVVGDSGNDVPMFDNFKNSFVMKHADDNIKKHASHEIKNVYELKNYM